MGWSNPPISWKEMERIHSGRPAKPPVNGRDEAPVSRKRQPFRAPVVEQVVSTTRYAELHAHSHYSFLDGASSPEELVIEAARLGLHGLALTDHDGMYGVVRFAEAAEAYPDLQTIYGVEVSLGLPSPQQGVADPVGDHLVLLARGQDGYHRLAGALTDAHLAMGAEKGRPVYDLAGLASSTQGKVMALTACRKGAVRRALTSATDATAGERAAERELARLRELFGRDGVAVELLDHGQPLDSLHNDALARVAARLGLPTVATTGAHYATPARHPLATALAAVRARRSLDELDGWLPGGDGAHLRSGDEMARRFRRYPGAVERTAEIADDLAFPLRKAKPGLPRLDLPGGQTPMERLRELAWEGAEKRYPGYGEEVRERLEKELAVIELKDFPGYFLIVHDIVQEARRRGILCQGRGSAANSALCYVLEITSVDSIFYGLPFERFLSHLRDEEPDIDVDFDSDRREEIIQYVYGKYGRRNAAQVANVITYRPKNAVRDMAKALGFSPGQQDAWSKSIDSWGHVAVDDASIPRQVVDLAQEVLTFPRHLGIHSGGMVLTDRPIGEVCPIEPARMEKRTVLQWDKDDCAWMGLVKFDLLGLGMLAALQYSFDLVAEHLGEHWTIETLPREEQGVYDMLCRADSIGVFQVESRAQMGTLPRLKPRCFYDLVIEVALIRPGPIQGGAVHPYLRRRQGEPWEYDHPLLKPVLERTLGIPLFQEQLMQMAVAVGGCDHADADMLRRAMGSKRGVVRIEALKDRLFAGMRSNGLSEEKAAEIYEKIQAFANFGFAESHSISFSVLVYASSWMKLHYPAAFLASLLRAQPMGFYSPQSLAADARRHGVTVLGPSLDLSGVHAGLERLPSYDGHHGRPECLSFEQPPVGEFDRRAPDTTTSHHRDLGWGVRLGLADVTQIGVEVAQRIVAARDAGGPFRDQADLARRVDLTTTQLEALAMAGAFSEHRRQDLWASREASALSPGQLDLGGLSYQPPLLPMLTEAEQLVQDLATTGLSPGDHPLRHLRAGLDERGVVPIVEVGAIESGRRIEVAGLVTHRQRPGTAGGVTFLNLEDETGLLNVVVSPGAWARYRRVARTSAALVVRGILQHTQDGVLNLVADRCEQLIVRASPKSRDFR
ncbi:error-prone DNA polymerase [Nocardioides jiangxiensis]|uniref:Error-prone DNA polymerase n=1 Tax=Nocardioides jiangxiensis TaxID=3064524 RepID=A0ABT9AXN5_9ACTN|nr:error-prone DNA polymerase [Nocardioides sp. WY-20]MDO7867219.1 error-prone DNA polymerase [Nocardioides sp. WY-20]